MQKNHPDLHLLEDKDNGLGEAYIKGMKYAIDNFDADVIIQMDADLQHDPDMLPLFLTLYTFGLPTTPTYLKYFFTTTGNGSRSFSVISWSLPEVFSIADITSFL